jgi:hypothetical protein
MSLTATMSSQSSSSTTEAGQLDQLLDVGSKVLDQALDLLNNSLTSDEQLTTSSKFLPGSTIGYFSIHLVYLHHWENRTLTTM